MTRHRLALAFPLFLASASSPAFADALPAHVDEAHALVVRGIDLRRVHRNEEALEAFQRAMALAPSPDTEAQVALAEQALGRWLDAARDLDTALTGHDDAWIEKNRGALDEARATVEGHLAWLTVDVPAFPTAQVELDGQAISPGIETHVLASAGTLVTRAPDCAPDVQRVKPSPGQHLRIAVSLTPLAQPVAHDAVILPPFAPAKVEPAASSRSVAGPIVLGAIGLAGVATGTVFGLRTIHQKNERDAECVGGCTPAGLTFDSQARTSATVSTVGFGVGVASLAGALTWWILSRPGTPALSAQIAPGTFALTVGGSL